MNANVSPDYESIDPIQLCPIDILKLQHAYVLVIFRRERDYLVLMISIDSSITFLSIGFETIERYQKLLLFYQNNNWKKEAEWMNRRIKQLNKVL